MLLLKQHLHYAKIWFFCRFQVFENKIFLYFLLLVEKMVKVASIVGDEEYHLHSLRKVLSMFLGTWDL